MAGLYKPLNAVNKADTEVKRKLTSRWFKIIPEWYPELLVPGKVFCVPPEHFNAVPYEDLKSWGFYKVKPSQSSDCINDEAQQRVLWSLTEFAKRNNWNTFILSNMEFQDYLKKDYEMCDSSAQHYPKANIKSQAKNALTMNQDNEEGDVDVLVIDKNSRSIIVFEIKSVGGQPNEEQILAKKFLPKIKNRSKGKETPGIIEQLKKNAKVMDKLMNCDQVLGKNPRIENPCIQIKRGIVLPNSKRDTLRKALNLLGQSEKDELNAVLGAGSEEDVLQMTLCADDLPTKEECLKGELKPEKFANIIKVWKSLKDPRFQDPQGEIMNDDLYAHVVALTCGPLTTVKVYTEKSMPRITVTANVVPARCRADTAGVTDQRFSELVLHQKQIDIISSKHPFVHLEGPPGTGKTITLLFRILTWLDEGHIVWLVSLSPQSRSITHLLHEQVKHMLETCKILQCQGLNPQDTLNSYRLRLRMFVRICPEAKCDEDPDYCLKRLKMFEERAKDLRQTLGSKDKKIKNAKVCVVLDETGLAEKGQPRFFDAVSQLVKEDVAKEKANQPKLFEKGLCVWSAALEHVGLPCYVPKPGEQKTPDKFGVLWELSFPMRCPPKIQQALVCVQDSLDQKFKDNVCCFDQNSHLPLPDGPNGNCLQYAATGSVVHVAHGSHKEPTKSVWDCGQCGGELGRYLKDELHIGEKLCKCGPPPTVPLPPPTVLIPHASPKCQKCGGWAEPAPMCNEPLKTNDVMIIATRKAYRRKLPNSGFSKAMGNEGYQIALSTSREEGDAPMPDNKRQNRQKKQVILVSDVTSIHGLERAVIIIIPNVRGEAGDQTAEKPDKEDDDDEDKEMLENGEEGKDKEEKSEEEEEDKSDRPENASVQVADVSSSSSPSPQNVEMEVEPAAGPPPKKSKTESDTEEAAGAAVGPPLAEPAHIQAGLASLSVDPPRSEADQIKSLSEADQIQAGLASLRDECRRDIFYIGSRAVCTLFFFHSGKKSGEVAGGTEGTAAVNSATEAGKGGGEELMVTSGEVGEGTVGTAAVDSATEAGKEGGEEPMQ